MLLFLYTYPLACKLKESILHEFSLRVELPKIIRFDIICSMACSATGPFELREKHLHYPYK